MVKRGKGNIVGAWAFLIGIILAVAIGLFSTYIASGTHKIILSILIVLGIVIGLLNISSKESSKFLLAALALVIVAFMGQSVLSIISQIGSILSTLLVLFVPATIIVALKVVFETGKD